MVKFVVLSSFWVVPWCATCRQCRYRSSWCVWTVRLSQENKRSAAVQVKKKETLQLLPAGLKIWLVESKVFCLPTLVSSKSTKIKVHFGGGKVSVVSLKGNVGGLSHLLLNYENRERMETRLYRQCFADKKTGRCLRYLESFTYLRL